MTYLSNNITIPINKVPNGTGNVKYKLKNNSAMESKRTILKRAMAKKYCDATRFDFLDEDEILLIYRAMEIYARQMCESQKPTSENVKALEVSTSLYGLYSRDNELMFVHKTREGAKKHQYEFEKEHGMGFYVDPVIVLE